MSEAETSSDAARPNGTDSRSREGRLETIIHRDANAALVVSLDGVVRHANPSAERLFGRAAADLVGRAVGIPLHGGETPEIDVRRPDGELAITELFSLETVWAGEAVFLLSLRDVTARAKAEEALRESEERYALAARAANDGLFDWNVTTNRVYYSPRWKSMLGYDEDEVGDSLEEWFSRVHPEDLDRVRAAVAAHIDGLTSHFENEYRIRHKTGAWRWVLCRGLASRDPLGRATRMAGSQSDVTHRKLAEQQLNHRAFYDPLTNLPNRALFIDRLRHAMRRAQRRKDYQFAVLFLDIDRFKTINDSLGHMAGDRLLVMAARRLELSLRPGDSVARLGGDEFTVLLEDIRDESDATRVADRIQRELVTPFDINGHEIVTSVSIGIARSATGYENPEDILRDADTAMYRAKAAGRAKYAIFDTAMHERAVALLTMEADLRRAIERTELTVYYQPIVSLDTGRICGVEALVRWNHPQRGLIRPNDFIPLAEETGLIVPIGKFVLAEACRHVRAWREEFDFRENFSLHVNLSGRQFSQADLVGQIRATLDDTRFEPGDLRLEITESVVMERPENARSMLLQLRELGVRLSIDDFGTGYSSLAYLQRFPIDTLKIDRSFVSGIGTKGENSEIARTIIDIGHNLGMVVVAEGVETLEQLAQMRALRCESAQGYLFSRPVDVDATRALLRSAPTW
ncbi:MAG: EAL domain-containing protein [Planctomycetes bacterium]|nr:EAL domain-containing protein [Planctomycetota bacterium]